MDKFKEGDRVVLARPDETQTGLGLVAGAAGTVIRADGDGVPKVSFESGTVSFANDSQLDPATPPQRNDRRERIATAVLAGFAADGSTAGVSGANLAREAVAWADALIEELDR